jgi:hypothetical protein
MAPGEGVFIKKPTSASSISITFTGEVLEGELSNPVVSGFEMYSPMVPQQGGLVAVHAYVPSNLDVVYQYNQGTGGYNTPKTYLAGSGIWTGGGEPQIAVGEALWIKASSAKAWVRTFAVPRE